MRLTYCRYLHKQEASAGTCSCPMCMCPCGINILPLTKLLSTVANVKEHRQGEIRSLSHNPVTHSNFHPLLRQGPNHAHS